MSPTDLEQKTNLLVLQKKESAASGTFPVETVVHIQSEGVKFLAAQS